jgi:adenylate cyclase
MRASLGCFNDKRAGTVKEPKIKIGMAVNSGNVAAGQIGNDERLEFTIIGDEVSLADKAETFNKPFGTEFLITEHTWALAGRFFVTHEMPSIKEKGKMLRMFTVINVLDRDIEDRLMKTLAALPDIDMGIAGRYVGPYGPRSLEDVRKLWGIEEPDLSKVDVEGEEKKYKVAEPKGKGGKK